MANPVRRSLDFLDMDRVGKLKMAVELSGVDISRNNGVHELCHQFLRVPHLMPSLTRRSILHRPSSLQHVIEGICCDRFIVRAEAKTYDAICDSLLQHLRKDVIECVIRECDEEDGPDIILDEDSKDLDAREALVYVRARIIAYKRIASLCQFLEAWVSERISTRRARQEMNPY